MSLSIFDDESHQPTKEDLKEKIAANYSVWERIVDHCHKSYSDIAEEWAFSGKKYGWSCRIVSKKRRLLYLIPCDGFFKVGIVFGEKATENALSSKTLSSDVIEIINSARVYAEGRGFRIDVYDETILEDIFELLAIKVKN